MPQSKKRGGAKNHRKKVQNRNNKILKQKDLMQKLFEDAIKQQVEELKKKNEELSGSTINAGMEPV